MKTSTKVKIMSVGVTAMGLVAGVSATPIIDNDTFEGLPSLGEQIGGFLTGLTPGVIAFTFALAVVGGIILIFVAIAKRIGSSVGGGKYR